MSLDLERYEIEDQPRILRSLFALEGETSLGVQPETMIKSKTTGRMLFVEVKKQGARGNAEERSFKHHTVEFYKTLKVRFGYDYHPFVTVWCESLAVLPRYTRKAVFLFEPKHYFLWVDYEIGPIKRYLQERCAEWLDGPEPPPRPQGEVPR